MNATGIAIMIAEKNAVKLIKAMGTESLDPDKFSVLLKILKHLAKTRHHKEQPNERDV